MTGVAGMKSDARLLAQAVFRRPSARARLALMYGGMSLVVGTVLLGIVYWFVDQRVSERLPSAMARTMALTMTPDGSITMGETAPTSAYPLCSSTRPPMPRSRPRRSSAPRTPART